MKRIQVLVLGNLLSVKIPKNCVSSSLRPLLVYIEYCCFDMLNVSVRMKETIDESKLY